MSDEANMGLKDGLDKGLDTIKTGAENVKDAISEAGHRAAAASEQAKRDAAGDDLTLGEKAGSILNQGKESAQAEIDAAKRDVRSNV